jgi:multicomponent Na+:H+ antiporter subunit E
MSVPASPKRHAAIQRWAALFCWTYLGWLVLTWTRTAEQLIFGAVASAVVAVVCAQLGDAVAPWRLLQPRRALAVGRIGLFVVVHIVRANLSLSRRIWLPSLPLRPGMVIVSTAARSDGALTAVGLLTSLIVDNQIVDVDRERHELQYHTVWTETGDAATNRAALNGPLEDLLAALTVGPDEVRAR